MTPYSVPELQSESAFPIDTQLQLIGQGAGGHAFKNLRRDARQKRSLNNVVDVACACLDLGAALDAVVDEARPTVDNGGLSTESHRRHSSPVGRLRIRCEASFRSYAGRTVNCAQSTGPTTPIDLVCILM